MSKGAYLIIEHTEALQRYRRQQRLNRSNKANQERKITALEVNFIRLFLQKLQEIAITPIWEEAIVVALLIELVKGPKQKRRLFFLIPLRDE